MKIYPYIFSLLTCIGIALPGYAQVDRNETLIRSALHGLEYEIKAGFSIGGTAPLPLPVEIRSIDGYNPTLAISIGGEVTKWIAVQNKLGIIVGLRLENKAMTTEATVKNYNMEILGQGGERISGVWTGGVKTKVHTAGLTIPLMATYKLTNRWNIKAGPYFSYLLSREFSGHVYEGSYRSESRVYRRQNCNIRFLGRFKTFPVGITGRSRMASLQAPQCVCRSYLGIE